MSDKLGFFYQVNSGGNRLRLADEAVRLNCQTVLRGSMHLCPPHLRNTSTSDTVILFCPAEPEAPCAAGRRGIPTLIPLCFSKSGRLIAKPDSSLCLLPSGPGFLHRSTLQWNLREYCRPQPGDSPEFKTIAFLVPLLIHFTVGASCQPRNKCRMCVILVHSRGDLFVNVKIQGFQFEHACMCACVHEG